MQIVATKKKLMSRADGARLGPRYYAHGEEGVLYFRSRKRRNEFIAKHPDYEVISCVSLTWPEEWFAGQVVA